MKVVTLQNIPEVPAPGAAEPTDGYSGPVHRTRQTIIETGESANFNCSIVNFSEPLRVRRRRFGLSQAARGMSLT